MSKESSSQAPIVGVGTTFDVSGHTATCIAIKREGVEITIPGVDKPVIVDFSAIEQAVSERKK